MNNREVSNLVIRNAYILPYGFRNFSGEPTSLNPQGGDASRGFALKLNHEDSVISYCGLDVLPKDIFHMLKEDGWTGLQIREPRDEDEEPTYILNVKLKYRYRNGEKRPSKYVPTVIQNTENGKIKLDEDTIGLLDDADISLAKISIRPYEWDKEKKPGRYSPQLKTLYVWLNEEADDEFAEETYGKAPTEGFSEIDDDDTPF